MDFTLPLMILELLVCIGSLICSILQVKLKKSKKILKKNKSNKKLRKDKNNKK